MKRDNKLKLHFNKKLNDIEGMLPLSETQGRWDIYLLFLYFINLKPIYNTEGLSLIQELENRGYDLKTIKFSIEKAQEKVEPIANKISIGHLSHSFKDFLFEFYIEGYILDRERFNETSGKEIVFYNRSERRKYKLLFKAPYYSLRFEGDAQNMCFGIKELNLFNMFLIYLKNFDGKDLSEEIIKFCKNEDEFEYFYESLKC